MDERPACTKSSEEDLISVEIDDSNEETSLMPAIENNEDTAPSSKYAWLYKANDLTESQEKRREMFLKMQKTKRNKIYDENRELPIFGKGNENMDLELNAKSLSKDFKRQYRYSNIKGMFSEWLTEVPCDLETEWFIKLCPIGSRNIIIASNYRTRAYKYGTLVDEFDSELPSGNGSWYEKDSTTVLDCIYNQESKTIFALDVILWKGQDLCESPASLRFFWLKSRLAEVPVQEISNTNNYRIIEVPEHPADLGVIEERLSHPLRINDDIVPLDGVLFYHKETFYISGRTPLVGWLKPYMIPEMLHIPVCEYFMRKKQHHTYHYNIT